MAPQMKFEPRWKEELVCTSPAGRFVLEMPMGVVSVYYPAKAAWAARGPAWAVPYWGEIHEQLSAWCAAENVPLYVDESAGVYEEP